MRLSAAALVCRLFRGPYRYLSACLKSWTQGSSSGLGLETSSLGLEFDFQRFWEGAKAIDFATPSASTLGESNSGRECTTTEGPQIDPDSVTRAPPPPKLEVMAQPVDPVILRDLGIDGDPATCSSLGVEGLQGYFEVIAKRCTAP